MEEDILCERFVAWENLQAAAREARRRKRRRPDVAAFEARREENLAELREELLSGTYRPGPYREFRLRDPKPRVIAAPAYRDRVVHHALMRVVGPIWERRFIDHNYACREGKGLHRAAEACRRYARRYPWALRIDVRRFYESVDHKILKGIFRRDFGTSRIVDVLGRVVDSYAPGIPIGSLTSQWFALRVLDPVDHYVQDFLRVPMVRYMDDMYCFGAGKAALRRVRRDIHERLRRLGLKAHPKKQQLMRVDRGVPFVGFRIFPDHIRVRGRSKVRALVRLRVWSRESRARQVDPDARRSAVSSWFGHWGWADTYYLRCATLCKAIF